MLLADFVERTGQAGERWISAVTSQPRKGSRAKTEREGCATLDEGVLNGLSKPDW
jgi:hypothetical protein